MKFRYRRHPTAETVAVGLIFLTALVASVIYFTRDTNGPYSATSNSHWTQLRSGVASTLLDIDFVDSRHGWAVGQGGTIVATSDGGDTWSQQQTVFELTIRSVDFIDARIGWAVGHLGLILHTADGGQTWSVQGREAALGQNLIHVRFDGPDSGWIISERGSFALRTMDGGATWDRHFFDSTLSRSDAFILDDAHAWVVLNSGGVLSTVDSGESWQLHGGVNQVQIGALGVYFLDDRNGWIAGWRGKEQGLSSGVQLVKYLTDGMIARTIDGGQTWTRVDSDTGRFLWDVAFVDSQEGWAVGSFGQAMYSSDGGRTWTPESTGSESTLRVFKLSDSNTGWAVGDDGTILKFTRN